MCSPQGCTAGFAGTKLCVVPGCLSFDGKYTRDSRRLSPYLDTTLTQRQQALADELNARLAALPDMVHSVQAGAQIKIVKCNASEAYLESLRLQEQAEAYALEHLTRKAGTK